MRIYIEAWAILVFTTILCVGCDARFSSTPAPVKAPRFSTASTMENAQGEASGEVWGVQIRIAETSDGGISSTFAGGVSASKGALNAKHTIVAGDVTIEFAADGFDPITLSVNSRNYGNIEEGSELLIDDDRNVMINNELRLPL